MTTDTWIKFNSREENWRAKSDDTKHDVPVMVRWCDVVAMKGIPDAKDGDNKTLIFVRAAGMDGWLEFSITDTIDEIVSQMKLAEHQQ
jgi:hypothetical protein